MQLVECEDRLFSRICHNPQPFYIAFCRHHLSPLRTMDCDPIGNFLIIVQYVWYVTSYVTLLYNKDMMITMI